MESSRFVKPPSPLGSRLEVFNPSRANVYAGYILTALFTFGGLAMIAWGASQIPTLANPPNPDERKEAGFRLLLGLFGFLILLGAFAFGWYTRSLARCRVEWFEHSFRSWIYGAEEMSVLWQDVVRIEEHVLQDDIPVDPVGLLIPPMTARRFVVVQRDGREFGFDRETVKRIGRLGKLLKTVAEQHAIPWVRIEHRE